MVVELYELGFAWINAILNGLWCAIFLGLFAKLSQ